MDIEASRLQASQGLIWETLEVYLSLRQPEFGGTTRNLKF